MRIRFLVTNAYASSGIVRTTFTMADRLAKRGHHVEIVSVFRHRSTPRLTPPSHPRVRIRPLYDRYALANEPKSMSLRHRWLLRYAMRHEEQPSTLVHSEDVRSGVFSGGSDILLRRYLKSIKGGVIIGTRPGLSLAIAECVSDRVVRVAQEHATMRRHGPALRAAITANYPRLDLVTALSYPATAEYEQALGPDARVARVPNSVPRSELKSKVRRPVVVAAGRVTRPKGFDRLIPAFAAATRTHPEWRLRIFGRLTVSPAHVEQLRRQISDLGLEDRVILEGFKRGLHAKMAKASILAHPSRHEGFPMVLLEAMACRLPVVSFDCPHGPADVVDDGVNGYLIPDGDTDAFARALSALMDDRERRRAFAREALKTARRYSPAHIAAGFEELLFDAAEAKGMRVSRPQPESTKGHRTPAATQ